MTNFQTPAELLQHIVKLNNISVVYFHTGRVSDAKLIQNVAIRMIQQVGGSGNACAGGNCSCCFRLASKWYQRLIQMIPDIVEHATSNDTATAVPKPFVLREKDIEFTEIYGAAFTISGWGNSEEVISPIFVSSVLLFNLALIYHTEGMKTGRLTQQKKSLLLYKRSIALQRKFRSSTCDTFLTTTPSVLRLLAALCLNMANIYEQLYQTQLVNTLIDTVAKIVSMIGKNEMSRYEKECFYKNLLLAGYDSGRCASAA